MAENKEIKKSHNFLQVAGVLLETNIEIEREVERELTNFADGNKKVKVTCDVAKKKDFKNPALLIEVSPKDEDGNIIGTYQIGVDFKNIGFGIDSLTYDKDGKRIDNENFKGIETILDKYVSKRDARDGEEPTRVFVKSGFLDPNEYVNKDNEYKVYLPTISTYNVTSTGVPEDDICEGSITGVIKNIIEETKGEDSEPTGRLIVEFYAFQAKGKAFPIKFIVEDDLADDFLDLYENGDCAKLYYDILTKTVGGTKKTSSGGMGRRGSHTTSGFTITEYSIFRGDDPLDEENEHFVSDEQLKVALKDRKISIEQAIEKRKEGGSSSSNSSRGEQRNRLSRRSKKIEEEETVDNLDEDSEELPFM